MTGQEHKELTQALGQEHPDIARVVAIVRAQLEQSQQVTLMLAGVRDGMALNSPARIERAVHEVRATHRGIAVKWNSDSRAWLAAENQKRGGE